MTLPHHVVGMLTVLLLSATPLVAQRLPLTRSAVPDSTNVVPGYHAMLRSAGVGGRVRATFVVDTTGRPVMASYVQRESTNGLLSDSVKVAIQQWRFIPARRGGKTVADTIEQIVEFLPTESDEFLLMPVTVLAREQIGPSQWRLVLASAPIPVVLPPVAESLHLAIAEAALDALLATFPLDSAYPPRIACIALGMAGPPVQPPLPLLRALSRPTYTAVASRRCPPTFGSPTRMMRADGQPPEPNPPGEDPWSFTPLAPRTLNDSTVLIDIAMTHATTFGPYHCYAVRDRTRTTGWRAVCRTGRMGVH